MTDYEQQFLADMIEKAIDEKLIGYKKQVASQAKYIGCLLSEIADLKHRIQEFVR